MPNSLFSLFIQNPPLAFTLFIALVISLTVHELAHAWAAYKLGDITAKYMGRLSFNPLVHLDPFGTLMLVFAGFGWAKPVPFNPVNLRYPKRDSALIALAGPASNMLLAILAALLINIVDLPRLVVLFLSLLAFYNLLLCFFNLIPIHPLDGFKIVYGILPINLAYKWEQLESYGPFFLLFLVFTRGISSVVSPFVSMFSSLLNLPI